MNYRIVIEICTCCKPVYFVEKRQRLWFFKWWMPLNQTPFTSEKDALQLLESFCSECIVEYKHLMNQENNIPL